VGTRATAASVSEQGKSLARFTEALRVGRMSRESVELRTLIRTNICIPETVRASSYFGSTESN